MFLKTELEMADLEKIGLQAKLGEAQRLLNSLEILAAPESEIICAKIQISTIERALNKAVDHLEDLRAQVSEAQALFED